MAYCMLIYCIIPLQIINRLFNLDNKKSKNIYLKHYLHFISSIIIKVRLNLYLGGKRMFFNYQTNVEDTRWVVGYSRISSAEKKEGYSILNQDMTCERIAGVLGEHLVKIYKDEGRSAFKDVYRKGYEELIKDVKANKIKVIIVWKSDRLLRNFIKSEKINQLFIKHHVTLISATEVLDFSTADGRKEVRKRNVDNQYESERTSERVLHVNKASAYMGNFPKGTVPLGYRRIHKDYAAAPIVIDEQDGPQVAYIFQKMCEMKWGIKKLLHWLNSTHYMGRVWYETYLYRLLQNPIYIGTYVDNIHNPTYSIEKHSPALIEKSLFEAVGDMIHGKHYDKKYKYIFKNYVYCDCCKKKLTPNPTLKKKQKKLYLYYYCETCRKRINETKLLKILLCEINHIILLNDCDKDIIAEKEKEYNRILYMIKNIDDYFLEGIIDQEYYDTNKRKYIQQKYSIECYMKKYQQVDVIYFNNMDFPEKRRWLKENIQIIYYNFDTFSVDIKKVNKRK